MDKMQQRASFQYINSSCFDSKTKKLLTVAQKINQNVSLMFENLIKNINSLYKIIEVDVIKNEAEVKMLWTKFQNIFDHTKFVLNVCTEQMCGKISKSNEEYFQCFECDDLKLCKGCFSIEKHSGHNFRKCYASSSNTHICGCGDHEKYPGLDTFCTKHNSRIDEKLSNIQNSKQSEEISFYFFLFFVFKNEAIKSDFQKQVFEKYSQSLFNYLIKNCEAAYSNKLKICKIMCSPPLNYDGYLDEEVYKKMILSLMFDHYYGKSECSSFVKLLKTMSSIKIFRRECIINYYKMKNLKEKNIIVNKELAQLFQQVLSIGSVTEELMKQEKIKPLVLDYFFQTDEKGSQAYKNFYLSYLKTILKNKNNQKLAQIILERVSLTQFTVLFGLKSENQKKTIKIKEDQVLYVDFLELVIQFYRLIADSPIRKNIWRKNLKICLLIMLRNKMEYTKFQYITIFTLSLFCILDGKIELIQNTSQDQLKQIFTAELFEKLKKELSAQIICHFKTLYSLKSKLYSKVLYRNERFKNLKEEPSHIIYSVDFMFLKILVLLYNKCLNHKKFGLMQDYYQQKQSEITTKIEQYEIVKNSPQSNEKASLKESCKKQLHDSIMQLEYFINYFLFLSQNNLAELKLADCLKINKETEILRFFGTLKRIHRKRTSKQFRKIALWYIRNQQAVRFFIKSDKFKSQNQRQNATQNFIISQNSPFENTQDQLPEQKKIKFKHRATEKINNYYTGVFFSKEMCIKIFSIYFKLIAFSAKNQAEMSLIVTKSVIETFLNLFIMTKEIGMLKLLSNMKKEQFFPKKNDVDMKMKLLEQIYFQISPKNPQKQQFESQEQKKINNKRNKLKQKMMKGQDFYLKKSLTQNKQQQSFEEDGCFVCHNNIDNVEQRLYYICYLSHTNLFSQKYKQKDRLSILIQSCHHKVHKKCCQKFLVQNDQVDFNCFVCKNISNLLIPIINFDKQDPKDIKQEVEELFNKIYLTRLYQLQGLEQFVSQNLYEQIKEGRIEESCSSVLNSIAFEIFFFGQESNKFFDNRLLKILNILLKYLTFNCHGKKDEEIKNFMKKNQRKIINAKDNQILEYIYCKIGESLGTKMAENQFNFQSNNIDNIFKEQKQLQTHPSKKPNHPTVTSLLNFTPIPKDFRELSKEMGICPQCNKISTQIVICFICNWKVCYDGNCIDLLPTHANENHLGDTLYIFVNQGSKLYYSKNDELWCQSIYEDEVGQVVNEDMLNCAIPAGKFMLNEKKYDKIVNQIVEGKIKENWLYEE